MFGFGKRVLSVVACLFAVPGLADALQIKPLIDRSGDSHPNSCIDGDSKSWQCIVGAGIATFIGVVTLGTVVYRVSAPSYYRSEIRRLTQEHAELVDFTVAENLVEMHADVVKKVLSKDEGGFFRDLKNGNTVEGKNLKDVARDLEARNAELKGLNLRDYLPQSFDDYKVSRQRMHEGEIADADRESGGLDPNNFDGGRDAYAADLDTRLNLAFDKAMQDPEWMKKFAADHPLDLKKFAKDYPEFDLTNEEVMRSLIREKYHVKEVKDSKQREVDEDSLIEYSDTDRKEPEQRTSEDYKPRNKSKVGEAEEYSYFDYKNRMRDSSEIPSIDDNVNLDNGARSQNMHKGQGLEDQQKLRQQQEENLEIVEDPTMEQLMQSNEMPAPGQQPGMPSNSVDPYNSIQPEQPMPSQQIETNAQLQQRDAPHETAHYSALE
jgi:hypothetical protein